MAKIICHKEYLMISSGKQINVYSTSGNFSLKIPSVIDTDKNRNSSTKESTKDTSNFLCMKFSRDGSYFGACDDAKNFAIWDTTVLPWSLLNCRNLARKCVALHFTKGQKVLIADKAGDVYECDLKNSDLQPVLLMGHISMLLDLTMSEDEKFLITCDRDEKIRVSCYPNAYNIKCFCMGHTEYVISCFILPMNPDILVSGSGDGTIRFWTFKTGAEIATICCTDHLSRTSISDNKSSEIGCLDEGTSSSTSKCPMKGLRFSRKLEVLTPLFSSSKLLLFKIDTGGPQLTWDHLQTLEFVCEPWDVTFNEDECCLLVLLPHQDTILEVFQYSTDERLFQRLTVSTTSSLSSSLKMIRSDWNFLKQSMELTEDYQLLFKQWYDNVKVYYDRKEERTLKKVKKS